MKIKEQTPTIKKKSQPKDKNRKNSKTYDEILFEFIEKELEKNTND